MSEDITALEQQSRTFARAMVIADAESYALVGAELVTIATYIKRVGEVFDPICSAAAKAHKVAVAQRDALLKPAMGAKRARGEQRAAWDQAQTRL